MKTDITGLRLTAAELSQAEVTWVVGCETAVLLVRIINHGEKPPGLAIPRVRCPASSIHHSKRHPGQLGTNSLIFSPDPT